MFTSQKFQNMHNLIKVYSEFYSSLSFLKNKDSNLLFQKFSVKLFLKYELSALKSWFKSQDACYFKEFLGVINIMFKTKV